MNVDEGLILVCLGAAGLNKNIIVMYSLEAINYIIFAAQPVGGAACG